MSTIPESKPLGLLIVGAGWIGTQRASAAQVARGTRLVGVYDTSEAAAVRLADHQGVPAIPNLATGLAWPGVDAVVVATPHADHFPIARRALQAGKHVLCEKPLAIDPYEARALVELAEERRLQLATGFNHRFYPPVAEALRLVEAQMIGPLVSLRAEIGHQAGADFLSSWHIDPSRAGGGTLMDNGPHACDLIRQFAGEAVAAKGYVADPLDLPEGCESEAFALFRCEGEATAILQSSWSQPLGYLTIELRGRDGFLRVETAPWRLQGRLSDGRKIHRRYLGERFREAWFRHRNGCERSFVRELEAFADPSTSAQPAANGWDGLQASQMVNAVYRAAEAGEEVLLDPLPTSSKTFGWALDSGEAA